MPTLTDLPPELVQEIVELIASAKRRKKQYLGAVCATLLPFSRRLAFSDVKVNSYERLSLLCDIIRGDITVGGFIRSLQIDCIGKEDTNQPKSSAVSTLLAHLPNAREVCINQSTRVAQILLAPASGRILPSMVVLGIECDFEGWSNPFDLSHFTNLKRYKSLNWLDYDVNRPISSLGRYKPPTVRPTLELGGLNLFGYLNGNPAVGDLISSCPFLASLLVIDKHLEPSQNLVPLLSHTRTPSNITFLSIGDVSPGDEDISLALTPYTDVEKLELRASSYTSALLPVLHSMQYLAWIHFAPFAEITCADLLQLLGPMKPPMLESIKISKVFESEGWDEYEEYRFKYQQGWTDAFSRTGLAEVMVAAKTANVKLVGYAVEKVEEQQATETKLQARLAATARKVLQDVESEGSEVQM